MSKEKKSFNLLAIAGLILISALLASFVGVSFFKTKTDEIVALTDARFEKFSVIFDELKLARLRAMGIGADTLLLSRRTVDPFVKRDRKGLAEVIDPFFQFAKNKHGIEQINFWIPPGVLFYRAEAPELGQFDVTKFRRTIKSAMDNQERIMAVETGQGGVVAIRGIVPIFQDEKFYGAIEFVSNFDLPLQNAAFQSNLKWGISLSQEVWKTSERPPNEKKDIQKGTDTYFQYSDELAEAIIRKANFDPRNKDYSVINSGDKKVFIKTIKVLNFSGVPTITIAVIDDLSDQFSAATQTAGLRAGVTFLVLALILIGGYLKFGDIRHGLLGAVSAERRLMSEQLERGNAAIDKLKDLEIIKRRFFSNLVSALSEPLLAIRGQLKSAMSQVEASDQNAALLTKPLTFAWRETERLQRLIGEYEIVELFRQNLVRPSSDLLSLVDVFTALKREIDFHLRFPSFSVDLKMPDSNVQTRGDEEMIVRAFMALVSYSSSSFAQGTVAIACAQDEQNWLSITFTGSAYAGSQAPSESLFDSSRQFLLQLASDKTASFNNEKILQVAMSKVIVEFVGGTLAIHPHEPGFIVRLPSAV
jgi:signal transduction histidine kinase